MARLRIETGRGAGKTVDVDRQAVIGRGETATLQIGDAKASREHCKVFDQNGQWVVADLNSRNGIKVNGVVTTRKNLNHGDRIEIGETVVVFETAGAAAKSAAPAPAAPASTAAAPAAAAPAKSAAPKPGASDAGARKAAAFAEARQQSARSAPAKSAPAAKAGAAKAGSEEQGLQVSDRVLQYHRIDARKASLLDVDMAQSTGMVKLWIWLGCLAFLALLVWVVSLMM